MIDKLFVEELDRSEMRRITDGKADFDLFSNRNYGRFSGNNFT